MSHPSSKPSLPFWQLLSAQMTRYQTGLDCCVLMVVVLLVFWPSLNYGYYSEDFDFALTFTSRSIERFGTLFLPSPVKVVNDAPAFYRPLGFLAWRIAGLFGGTDPVAQHALSLALHAINALLVYALFRSIRGLNTKTAWLGAALFAIFPSHSEAIIWSAAHFDQLALCFSLLTLLAAIKIRSDWLAALLSSTLYLLALCSKEAAIITPILLALWLGMQWLQMQDRQGFKLFVAQHIWRIITLGALSVGYLLWRIYLFGNLGGYRQAGVPLHERQSLADLIEHGKGLLYFAFLSLDWPGLLRHSSSNGIVQWLIALLITLVIVGIGIGLKRKQASASQHSLQNLLLGVAWIMIAILPPLSLANDWYWLTSSRFFYIGSVGSGLVLALSINWLLEHSSLLLRRVGYCGACGLILVSSAGLLGVNQRWQATSHDIQEILSDIHKAVPEPGLHATFLLPRLPDNQNTIFMFRNGTNAAIQLSYNDTSIQVFPLNSEKPVKVARPDRVYAFMMDEGQIILHPDQNYFAAYYARLGYTPGLTELDWQGEFGQQEQSEFHQWRWLKEQGCLLLKSEREQVINLAMLLWTAKPQHELTISLEGQTITKLQVGPEPQEVQLASITLKAGEQCLHLQSDGAQTIDSSLQNGDQRVVSVAVADVIIELATHLNAAYLPEHPLEVELDEQIAFLGYDIYRANGALWPGQQFTLQTYWKALKRPNQDLHLLVQLLDRRGQLVYQVEQSVVGDDLPTSQWRAGELLRGTTTISLPDDLPIGPYSVQLQLLDPVSQRVLPLTNAPNQPNSGILLGIW